MENELVFVVYRLLEKTHAMCQRKSDEHQRSLYLLEFKIILTQITINSTKSYTLR